MSGCRTPLINGWVVAFDAKVWILRGYCRLPFDAITLRQTGRLVINFTCQALSSRPVNSSSLLNISQISDQHSLPLTSQSHLDNRILWKQFSISSTLRVCRPSQDIDKPRHQSIYPQTLRRAVDSRLKLDKDQERRAFCVFPSRRFTGFHLLRERTNSSYISNCHSYQRN